jgi:hypothetical protein
MPGSPSLWQALNESRKHPVNFRHPIDLVDVMNTLRKSSLVLGNKATQAYSVDVCTQVCLSQYAVAAIADAGCTTIAERSGNVPHPASTPERTVVGGSADDIESDHR